MYPPSMIDEDAVPTVLQRLATERDGLHRKRLIWSVVGMPIAAPFGLVPVVPNIPFFYLAYRGVAFPVPSSCLGSKTDESDASLFALERYVYAYTRPQRGTSSYMSDQLPLIAAISGAKHLNFLVGNDLLRPLRSAALDSVYARHATAKTIDSDRLVGETRVEWKDVEQPVGGRGEAGKREILLIEGQDAQTVSPASLPPTHQDER